VPRPETGRFFGRLRATWQTVTIGLFIICAALITPDAPPARFQLVIALLIACMAVRIIFVSRLPQRHVAPTNHKSVLSRLAMMFADKPFMRYTWFSIAAAGTTFLIFPSMLVYTRRLGFSQHFLVIAMLLKMTASALSYLFWGRLADHRGSGANYRLGFMLAATAHLLWLPASWLILTAGERAFAGGIILLIFTVYGAGESGIGIAVTRHGFHLTPRERAPTYLAVQPILMAVVPAAGVFLLGWTFALLHAGESTAWLNPYVASALLAAAFAAALIPIAAGLLQRQATT